MFRVYFTSRADKELDELPRELKQRIYNELKVLSENPFLHHQVRKVEIDIDFKKNIMKLYGEG